jgi:hypothetical protein
VNNRVKELNDSILVFDILTRRMVILSRLVLFSSFLASQKQQTTAITRNIVGFRAVDVNL